MVLSEARRQSDAGVVLPHFLNDRWNVSGGDSFATRFSGANRSKRLYLCDLLLVTADRLG